MTTTSIIMARTRKLGILAAHRRLEGRGRVHGVAQKRADPVGAPASARPSIGSAIRRLPCHVHCAGRSRPEGAERERPLAHALDPSRERAQDPVRRSLRAGGPDSDRPCGGTLTRVGGCNRLATRPGHLAPR
jgi:hypothetical protein